MVPRCLQNQSFKRITRTPKPNIKLTKSHPPLRLIDETCTLGLPLPIPEVNLYELALFQKVTVRLLIRRRDAILDTLGRVLCQCIGMVYTKRIDRVRPRDNVSLLQMTVVHGIFPFILRRG